jgi:hypothetical protein
MNKIKDNLPKAQKTTKQVQKQIDKFLLNVLSYDKGGKLTKEEIIKASKWLKEYKNPKTI